MGPSAARHQFHTGGNFFFETQLLWEAASRTQGPGYHRTTEEQKTCSSSFVSEMSGEMSRQSSETRRENDLYAVADGLEDLSLLEKPSAEEAGKMNSTGTSRKSEGAKQRRRNRRGKKGRKERSKRTIAKRWKSLPPDWVDPISLEPLASMTFPPFCLPLVDAGENVEEISIEDLRSGASLFDGTCLAEYLIASGNLVHPISRRPLTRLDCERLDRYLVEHNLNVGRVTDVFNASKIIVSSSATSSSLSSSSNSSGYSVAGSGRDRQRRAQTSALLGRMISFPTYRHGRRSGLSSTSSTAPRTTTSRSSPAPPPPPPSQFRYRPRRHGGNVIDDDDWVAVDDVDTDAFPTLGSGAVATRESATTSALPSSSCWRRRPPIASDSRPSRPFDGRKTVAPRTRPKLQLKRRTIPLRDDVRAEPTTTSSLSSVDTLAKFCDDTYMCPYSPALLRFTSTNMQWVSRVERQLRSMKNSTIFHPPMKLVEQAAIRAICIHWGLDVTLLDGKDSRSIQVMAPTRTKKLRSASSTEGTSGGEDGPPVSLWDAPLRYAPLLDLLPREAVSFDELNHRSTIHLGNFKLSRNGVRPTPRDLQDFFESTVSRSIRRSSYCVRWIGGHDLLVEFVTIALARKAMQSLKAIAASSGGSRRGGASSFRFGFVQVWGGEISWGELQAEVRDDVRREILDKMGKSHQASTRNATTRPRKDSWDDEEEQDEENKKIWKSAGSAKTSDREDLASKPTTTSVWATLAGDDEDDEDEWDDDSD